MIFVWLFCLLSCKRKEIFNLSNRSDNYKERKNDVDRKKEWKKILLRAVKIAVGSSAAIYIAERMGLEYAASAGGIALLTLVTTKWETVKLSVYRLLSFFFTVLLAELTIGQMKSEWIAYGIFMFVVMTVCHALGWQDTMSVNSVIGTHFLMTKDFGYYFVINEFLLVVIGIAIAFILNLFYDYKNQKNGLINSMRDTENRLQKILGSLAAYLAGKDIQVNVWEEIRLLECDLDMFIRDACEYQDNTFHSYPGYYIDYFEMRMKQVGILHNLHYEIKKIREIPRQAMIIAEYILYLTPFVVEVNFPDEQISRLERIFSEMKKEPLPVTREEFEGRAVLYHILMDLEEFLIFKKQFVEGLDDKQMERYWNQKKEEWCRSESRLKKWIRK